MLFLNDIFRFGPVLMRLALTLDKTDQILELYLKEVKNKQFFYEELFFNL